jgi:pimeloyl-ACP methyl ester carboxylesterase
LHKQISYRNGKIHYYKTGNGKACLVLLHGFLENLSMWQHIIPEFSKTHTVVAIDLPGHGKTSTLADIHTMELMADVVNEVLKEEGIKQAKFIGHSMGGYVALAFGKKHPSKTQAICLMNSSAMADNAQKKKDRLRAAEILQRSPKLFINEAIPNLCATQNKGRLKKEISEATAVAQTTDTKGAVACTLGMRLRSSSVAWMQQQTKIKFCFVAGRNDSVIPVQKVITQAKKTNAQLHIIENCGHMAHIENRTECVNFLKEVLVLITK